jgi:hypothetical protein
MIPALLLTLAVVAAPVPKPSGTPRPDPPNGCPSPAIGFYRFTPAASRTELRRSAPAGYIVDDLESYGGGSYANGGSHTENGVLVLRFSRDPRDGGRFPAALAVAEVDPDTHGLRARVGTVRKVGGQWCMFSAPSPVARALLKR